MLLMHSGLSDVRVTKMLKRVKKLCKENPELCPVRSRESKFEYVCRIKSYLSQTLIGL